MSMMFLGSEVGGIECFGLRERKSTVDVVTAHDVPLPPQIFTKWEPRAAETDEAKPALDLPRLNRSPVVDAGMGAGRSSLGNY